MYAFCVHACVCVSFVCLYVQSLFSLVLTYVFVVNVEMPCRRNRGATHNWGWASGGASILSEFGTMQLEFEYLSIITGNPKYMQAVSSYLLLICTLSSLPYIVSAQVQKVFDFVIKKPRPPLLKGLYPNYLDPNTGNWGSS